MSRAYRWRHDWITSGKLARGNRTWKRGQNWPHKWPLRRKERERKRGRGKVRAFHFLAAEVHDRARFSSSTWKENDRGGTKDSLKLLLSTCRRSARSLQMDCSYPILSSATRNGRSISGDRGWWSIVHRADPTPRDNTNSRHLACKSYASTSSRHRTHSRLYPVARGINTAFGSDR